ncbi:hypothetical protein ABPG72_019923 [Tetrahymena utriculariae]
MDNYRNYGSQFQYEKYDMQILEFQTLDYFSMISDVHRSKTVPKYHGENNLKWLKSSPNINLKENVRTYVKNKLDLIQNNIKNKDKLSTKTQKMFLSRGCTNTI